MRSDQATGSSGYKFCVFKQQKEYKTKTVDVYIEGSGIQEESIFI